MEGVVSPLREGRVDVPMGCCLWSAEERADAAMKARDRERAGREERERERRKESEDKRVLCV